jgi:HAD superfamily hydrolase (TIGR01549 family)
MAIPLRAVIFDAYGTLVEITDKRKPYRRLFEEWAPDAPRASLLTPLRSKTTLPALAAKLGVHISPDAMATLQADLAAELSSIRAFADVAPIWTELRSRGVRIGICSNLATPYIQPVLGALPFPPDAACWSCECGMTKDDPHIYLLMCARLGVNVSQTLMVGDDYAKDYFTPRKINMHSLHLRRGDAVSTGHRLASLYDLLRITDL